MKRNNKTKVSVIVPCYNRAELLIKAVRSILNQTYQNLEIIIIDDCSTDHTNSVVNSIKDNRIVYIKHDENKGAAAARNTGITASTGDLIAFLDSDDIWMTNKLELQIDLLRKNPMLGIVYTGFFICNDQEKFEKVIPKCDGNILLNLLKGNCVNTTSTILVRRDLLTKIGGFDSSLPSCQDWDLYIRLSKITMFGYVEDPLVLFYQHDGIRISTNYDSVVKGHLSIYRKYKSLSMEFGETIFRDFYENVARIILKTSILYKDKQSIKIARGVFLDGIKESRVKYKINGIIFYLCTFSNVNYLNKILMTYNRFKKIAY